jgi:hypothetical protein
MLPDGDEGVKRHALEARFGGCGGRDHIPHSFRREGVLDPANKAQEILTLQASHYELHCCAEEKGKLTSLLLPGLEFDLTEIQY